MESRNPVFNSSNEFKRGGHATFRTDVPSAADLVQRLADEYEAAKAALAIKTGFTRGAHLAIAAE